MLKLDVKSVGYTETQITVFINTDMTVNSERCTFSKVLWAQSVCISNKRNNLHNKTIPVKYLNAFRGCLQSIGYSVRLL